MRRLLGIALCAMLATGTLGCGDDDDNNGNNNTTGTLIFKMQYGDANSPKPRAMNTCSITDVRALHQSLEVSMDDVPNVAPADVTWHEFYAGTTPKLGTEMDIQATLPAGTYRAMRITQRNELQWVVDCPGIGAMEVTDYNNRDASPMDILPPTVVTPTGLYVADGDTYTVVAAGEKMSTFDVQAGGTTVITWRSHFNTLDWDDTNDNDVWDAGEDLDNWTLIAGETTMFGFDIEYQ